jgi:hypothetical protein
MAQKTIKLTCKVQTQGNHYSLALPDEYRELVQNLLKYCFENRGGFVSFQLAPPRRPRSTGKGSQSAHFNGDVQQIAEATGQPFADVKKYLKSLAVGRGYPMLTNEDGSPLLDLWGNIQGISEADSTVEDCKILIDTAHQFADEYQIKLIEE